MVAYNFQSQFVPLIESGQKRQTIRALCKRRHAQPGQEVQLYTGMRTKHCRLIGFSQCVKTEPISISSNKQVVLGFLETAHHLSNIELEELAIADGFGSSKDFFDFFEKMRGLPFTGVVIEWGALKEIDRP